MLAIARQLPVNDQGKFYDDAPLGALAAASLKAKDYRLAMEAAANIKSPSDRAAAIAAVEFEVNRSNVEVGEEVRAIFSRIGCTQP